MTKYVDNNIGSVATSPGGSWDPDANYPQFKQVTHNHDTWTSKKNGNHGHEPQDNSEWWFRNSDGGKHAWDEGEAAKAKGQFAQEQGLRAKNFSDHPPKIISGWWYCWSESQNDYVKTIEADINISEFTEEQLAALMERAVRPHVSGSTLVFPSSTGVSVTGSTLNLNV